MAQQIESGVGYLEPTLLPAQVGDVLEVDELWSYVGNKKNKVWIWLALCRRTRQIVAWRPGSREAKTVANCGTRFLHRTGKV